MSTAASIKAEVLLSPRELAEAFCQLNDEAQAQFFIEVAAIAASWTGTFPQWLAVGRHLGECQCATDGAREMVRDIVAGLEAQLKEPRS